MSVESQTEEEKNVVLIGLGERREDVTALRRNATEAKFPWPPPVLFDILNMIAWE